MDLLVLKIILIVVMTGLTIIFGLLPVKVLRLLRKRANSSAGESSRWPSLALCLLSCFTGGVFLSTCFLHLLPETNMHLSVVKKAMHWDVDYPLAELISCVGFFLVFFVEECVVLWLGDKHHNHAHTCQPNSARNAHSHNNHHHHHHEHHDHVHCDLQKDGGEGGTSPPVSELRPDLCETEVVRQRLLKIGPSELPEESGDGRGRVVSPFSDVCVNLELAEPERCEGPCDGVAEDPPILMSSKPHAHSHEVRSLTLIIALSFHSIIEGLAFGVQQTTNSVATLFVGLVLHKIVIAFSVGLQLSRTHAHKLQYVLLGIVMLAVMSPIGSTIGIAVEVSNMGQGVQDVLVMVFEGLSVGTFLYVTFFEILIHERDNEHPNLLKLLFIVVGFSVIAAIRLLQHDHPDASHAHDHTSHDHVLPNATVHS